MITQEKIHALGARETRSLLINPDYLVRIDEKVDGSQITFGVFDGKLRIRSKSQEITDHTQGMFVSGIQAIYEFAGRLWSGYTYHGEYLQRPKHNVLKYGRIPRNYVVVFDVVTPEGKYMHLADVAVHLEEVGAFECVQATVCSVKEAHANYFPVSNLGGTPEGVVLKLGDRVDNRLVAKLVSAQFKETKSDNTTRNTKNPDGDLAITLANRFCTRGRYAKAVQYLREIGQHTGTMRDVGLLHKRVGADLEAECADEMKAMLWKHYRKSVLKHALRGLAPWYEQLLTNDNAFWEDNREAILGHVRPGDQGDMGDGEAGTGGGSLVAGVETGRMAHG